MSRSWPQLLLSRVVVGIGLGVGASTVSIFAAECAPPSIRGGLAVSWQMWVAFGVFAGFLANVAFFSVSKPLSRFNASLTNRHVIVWGDDMETAACRARSASHTSRESGLPVSGVPSLAHEEDAICRGA